MAGRIEDYALIGDTPHRRPRRQGRLHRLDVRPPLRLRRRVRALLGTPEHGRWQLAPAGGVRIGRASVPRRHARARDDLPHRRRRRARHRLHADPPARGRSRAHRRRRLGSGPDAHGPPHPLRLRHRSCRGSRSVDGQPRRRRPVPNAMRPHVADPRPTAPGCSTVADFVVEAGDRVPFVLAWYPSHEDAATPRRRDRGSFARHRRLVEPVGRSGARVPTETGELVMRSLITLKALTYAPTGGIVAAPTTSLPEWIGSVRNWDYRYCWLRDSVLTLGALMVGGYHDEAHAWRDWLLRAAAGDPAKLQIMYGVTASGGSTSTRSRGCPATRTRRRCASATPRAASSSSTSTARRSASLHLMRTLFPPSDDDGTDDSWPFETALLEFLEGAWHQPDDGLWEMRGGRQHFTHSKVMAWLAFHSRGAVGRAVRPARAARPLASDPRRHPRARCATRATTPISGRSRRRSARRSSTPSLLQLPMVGFLPADDERDRRHRRRDRARAAARRVRPALPLGARRRRTAAPARACSCRARSGSSTTTSCQGRMDEARALFDRLAGTRERRRAVLRGVRPARRAPAREHAAGVHPPRLRAGGAPRHRGRAREPPVLIAPSLATSGDATAVTG